MSNELFDQLEAALRDYHALMEDKFSEFDLEVCTDDDEGLCPQCESNGCINLKIRNARAVLDLIDDGRR
jgi:hypothetical protein